jgi:two-component sensor histidine kinase
MPEIAHMNEPQEKNPQAMATDVAEANHRIANSLQLIVILIQRQATRVASSGQSMTPAEAAAFLRAVESRISTVARLHRLLSEVGDDVMVDFPSYLGEICDMLRDSIAAHDVLEFDPPKGGTCQMPTNKALPLALIAVEAVTNSIKYAHPTGMPVSINVSCRNDRDALLMEISDDGVGFPEGFNVETDDGIGIHAMRLLSRSAGAALSFESTALGLTCRVEIPL